MNIHTFIQQVAILFIWSRFAPHETLSTVRYRDKNIPSEIRKLVN